MNLIKRFTKNVLSLKGLDTLCITFIFICLIYELPASAMASIATAFGLFNEQVFYQYRLLFAVLVIAVAGINLLVNHRYIFRNHYFILYLFFLTYITTIIWLNRDIYALETNVETESVSALTFYLPMIFKYILFFFVGFYLPRLRAYRRLLLIVTLALSCLILLHVDFEKFGIDTANYVDRRHLGLYLFVGDATSIAALISIAFFKTKTLKILFIIFSTIVIFFIGSRTSVAVFTATVIMYFIVSFKPKLVLATSLIFIATAIWVSSLDFSELEARNPRMFGVLVDFDGDNSVLGREELADYGWNDISENPLMGRFGGQTSSGPPNSQVTWRHYMHDVFSYWRQFGAVAMLIIVIYAIRFFFMLWHHRKKRQQPVFALYFLLGVFIFIETAFSRSFAFPYAHIFFGLCVAIDYAMTTNNKEHAPAARYYQPREHTHSILNNNYKKRRSRKKKIRF